MHQFKGTTHQTAVHSDRGYYNTSLHDSNLDTQHPLRSGTDTWARRFQSRHPAPGQRRTSSLLPDSHTFILKKFVARIELLSVSRSCHRGASGRCQGLLHLRWDTPRNLCLPCKQNTVWACLGRISFVGWRLLAIFCACVAMWIWMFGSVSTCCTLYVSVKLYSLYYFSFFLMLMSSCDSCLFVSIILSVTLCLNFSISYLWPGVCPLMGVSMWSAYSSVGVLETLIFFVWLFVYVYVHFYLL